MTATGLSVSWVAIGANLPRGGEIDVSSWENGSAIRVLLADDDEAYASSLRQLIEQQPELTVVGIAYDGLEAVRLAGEIAPDAVVVDLHMPRLSGVETVGRLRRNHPHLCLIALTGDPDPRLHAAAAEAGADGVLVKGEIVDALVARLRGSRSG
jgi:two-component system, NarL family, response regulator DesR